MDNTINSLVSQAVGVTDQQIKDFLATNPSDAQITSAMQTYGVSPTQLAGVVGMPVGEVVSRVAATIPYGNTAKLGDVVVQPIYDVQGSGENEQVGPITSINVTKSTGNVNDKAPVGSQYQTYNPNGTLQGTGTVQKYDDKFTLGSVLRDIVSNPGFKLAALAYGGNALADALGGAGVVGSDLAGLSGIPAGAGALTAAEQAALYGTAGAAGLPTAGAIGSDLAGLSGIPAGSGALTAAEQAALYGTGGASLGTIAGMGAGTGITAAGGLGGTTGAAGLGGSLGAGVGGVTTGGLAAGNSLLGGAALGSTLGGLGAGVGGSLLGSTIGNTIGNTVGSALGTTLGQGLGLSALGTLAGTAANQSGISDARNLINQYGGIANNQLNAAYQNAQNLNAGNRTDLGNVYQNLNTNLNNTLNAQAGLYGQTNTNLANNYANTLGNMQNLYSQQVGYQQPYQDIGRAGSQGLLANQDYLTRQFNANDLNTNLAPNYAFQLQQGQMANQRAGNAAGGALGGNALQGLQRYTQDYAGNAYQQAFNNFNQQRNNIYNSLAGMANIGTTSAGQLAGLGNTYGSNLGALSSNYGGNMLSNAGQLQGAYNQYGGNLTNAANTYSGNLTTNAGQGIGAANAYGLNTANLATGLGSALAGNAVAGGANTANALNTLGNTALLGSLIKPT